ncbi:helix-turn-helix transcriptional regulator [Mesorhizobium sp. B283B1A]|uniref:helix-turn-helix transcriptional regulator n=1 Tax=Mesorhizobium TaxID=68287 RepID=UPI00120CE002|nr:MULTISPECIES: helix-turn-helix transcriptional regulator [Mesorhizobium]MCA0046761.1 helix-turn-helix transcriptional regulator [Mesorhizobium sp. B283B1A]TJU99914.1 MAG: helix-turn-helix domain-containing protein [Mesorhizobium sp.]UQS61879.1 helix-turn-helix transcriptional regulator [Mesorhizobium opportunistum]
MDAPSHSAEDSRRRELGAFLRSRRERLTPSATGIATGLRRRTPGLRREEVAMIAGVGTTWYTWLEQGRDVRPSVEVLTALSEALRLDAIEKRHLFILAGRQQPERRVAAPEKVDGALLHMLQSLVLQPAYVVGRRWDVLAWNPAAVAVFGDYGLLEGDARNIVHMVFTNPHHRRLLVDWEELARVVLASFRAESAKYVGDPDFDRLIALMMRSSPEFRDWWPRRDVARRLAGLKHVRHPTAGAMAFEHMSLSIDDGSDMRLVVYTPLAEQNSIAKLQTLLDALPAKRRSA